LPRDRDQKIGVVQNVIGEKPNAGAPGPGMLAIGPARLP
jgi:hypothetical protein